MNPLRKLSLVGAMLLTVGGLHATPSAAAQVPVSNAGFESPGASGLPAGWTRGWAVFRGGEVRDSGFHDVDALAVALPESPAPELKPLGSAGAGD